MEIHSQCRICGKPLEVVAERGTGKNLLCSTCRNKLHTPSTDKPSEQKCFYCCINVPVPANLSGRFFRCPHCNRLLVISKYIRRLQDVSDGVEPFFRQVLGSWRKVLPFAVFILLFSLAGRPFISLLKDKPKTAAPELSPNHSQIRHDQIYSRAMQSFVAPATNSMLEIITKNNVHQKGTVDFIDGDKVILNIGGSKHTYNRDWLSQRSREAILAPDYAEAFVRNTLKAERDQIERDKADRVRKEKERTERESAAREAEIERRRAENEKAVQQEALLKAQIARAQKGKAEKEAAKQYDQELQRRAEQEWNDYAMQNGGSQFVGEPGSGQLVPAPQDNSQWTSSQSEEAMDEFTGRVIGNIRQSMSQPRGDFLPPRGTPPTWQVREGPPQNGVRTLNENQFLAQHNGRYGGSFQTARAARNQVETLNVQQQFNLEAIEAYQGSGSYQVNMSVGRWTYDYDPNSDSFVVYQQ